MSLKSPIGFICKKTFLPFEEVANLKYHFNWSYEENSQNFLSLYSNLNRLLYLFIS